MWPILIGLETEYGLAVEGRGAEDQVDDATALVRCSPDGRFLGWDYRFESPRSDLRGFRVDALSQDPEDARFDRGRVRESDQDVRSDRILPNGARLYNDHGHPEVATPECWSVEEVAHQDLAGDLAVMNAAESFSKAHGRDVAIYKNNTDFHGSSYGTHESYLVPRTIGFDRLFRAVVPVLIARQVVCGAGKVGSESGTHCDFQISQRADFFTESASVDTLYRRPVFNTRDEPHADSSKWARMHVITGDANRQFHGTARKFALVKLALWLEAVGQCPEWRVQNPVRAMSAVSRDVSGQGRIELEGSWTTAEAVLESYIEAAVRHLDPGYPFVSEAVSVAYGALETLQSLRHGLGKAARTVDWAAKLQMLIEFAEDSGTGFDVPSFQSYDLAFHRLGSSEGLFEALVDLERVEANPDTAGSRLSRPHEATRALARSLAVTKHLDALVGVSWGCLTFEMNGKSRSVPLDPTGCYSHLEPAVKDTEAFVKSIEDGA